MTSIHHRPLLAALLALFLLVSHTQAQTAPATSTPAAAPTSAPAAVVDAKSAAVLHKMADYYKSIKTAATQLDIALKFDGAGHKDEMHATGNLAIERPNKLALTLKDDKVGVASVVTDGKKMWMSLPDKKKYSEEDAPASLDEILINSPADAVSQQASIVLVLFHSQNYDKLLANVDTATYIGQDDMDGAKYDHVRTSMQDVDVDLWIAAGDKPLLRRVKPNLTRRLAAAVQQQPEMKGATFDASIDMKSWTIDQPIAADQLAFTPPAGFDKVDSMEEVLVGDQPALKLKGLPAPDFTFDLLGGGKTTLAEHKGKDIVILDFWATWCGPCVEGLPVTVQVAKDHAAQNVVLYAVNQQEDETAITAFLKQHNLDVKVGLDKDGSISKAFMVQGIPQTIIIGKDGIIKVVHIGTSPKLKDLLTHDLEKVIAGK